MTWLRASMWVSALPWMFMPIWSMANDSPSPGALSPVCVIVCRAGSGLSAVTRYSMGQANDTDRRGALNYLAPATMLAAVGEGKLGRSAGPQDGWARSRSYRARNLALVIGSGRAGAAPARVSLLPVIRSASGWAQ